MPWLGFLEPDRFLELFGHVETPAVLHHGPFTRDLQDQVENGTLEGMTFEGIVAKGPYATPGRPLMFKWKNRAWLDRLRRDCADEAEFELRK